MKEDVKPAYPDKSWFEEEELDKSIETIEYKVKDEVKRVSFLIQSMNYLKSNTIMNEYQTIDETDMSVETDWDGFQDRLLRECVSFGDPPKQISQEQLDAMKRTKKGGIYKQLVLLVTERSGILPPDKIEKEKNLESPIQSTPSS